MARGNYHGKNSHCITSTHVQCSQHDIRYAVCNAWACIVWNDETRDGIRTFSKNVSKKRVADTNCQLNLEFMCSERKIYQFPVPKISPDFSPFLCLLPAISHPNCSALKVWSVLVCAHCASIHKDIISLLRSPSLSLSRSVSISISLSPHILSAGNSRKFMVKNVSTGHLTSINNNNNIKMGTTGNWMFVKSSNSCRRPNCCT